MGWLVLPDNIHNEEAIQNPDYPPGKWWLAHGSCRILTDSSPEYIQWLRNIERDSVVYGYEDRVHLGNHGLHHTPEMEFGENYEFQYYDPTFNDSTFARIVHEFELLGLTAKSLKWIRFPGFKFTRATIEAIIKNGFILFDYWRISDRVPWMLFYTEHGRLWGVGTQWQGDMPHTYAQMDSIFLRRGKLCHTAGHPSKWFDWHEEPDSSYPLIHEIFQQAEDYYPNLGYMFPDEVAEYAFRVYDMLHFRAETFANALVISFGGSVPQGHTVVAEWPDSVPSAEGITVDGQEMLEIEVRGRRLFIVLPELGDGLHVIHVPFFTGTSAANQHTPSYITLFQNYPNPFNMITTFPFTLPERTHVTLSVYNLEGKLIKKLTNNMFDAGINKIDWNGTDSRGTPVSSGVYFYRLKARGKVLTKKMVVLK
jgi:hypothetical protein